MANLWFTTFFGTSPSTVIISSHCTNFYSHNMLALILIRILRGKFAKKKNKKYLVVKSSQFPKFEAEFPQI